MKDLTHYDNNEDVPKWINWGTLLTKCKLQ